jgi:ubiquinone/menaquinone biosynthesis C-methylase UbiE
MESIWTSTTDLAYMAAPERQANQSHEAFLEWVVDEFDREPISLLDIGVLSGVTWQILTEAGVRMQYTGIDIAQRVIDDCRMRMPDATWMTMSATDLVFNDESYDVVHARHLLECLPYYETAVREMFRVARSYVVLCFFQTPAEPELLHRRLTGNGYIWLNRYSPDRFHALLDELSSQVRVVETMSEGRRNTLYFCRK